MRAHRAQSDICLTTRGEMFFAFCFHRNYLTHTFDFSFRCLKTQTTSIFQDKDKSLKSTPQIGMSGKLILSMKRKAGLSVSLTGEIPDNQIYLGTELYPAKRF